MWLFTFRTHLDLLLGVYLCFYCPSEAARVTIKGVYMLRQKWSILLHSTGSTTAKCDPFKPVRLCCNLGECMQLRCSSVAFKWLKQAMRRWHATSSLPVNCLKVIQTQITFKRSSNLHTLDLALGTFYNMLYLFLPASLKDKLIIFILFFIRTSKASADHGCNRRFLQTVSIAVCLYFIRAVTKWQEGSMNFLERPSASW